MSGIASFGSTTFVSKNFYLGWNFLHLQAVQGDMLLQNQLKEAGLQQEGNQSLADLAISAYFGERGFWEPLVFDNGTTLLHFAALGGQEDLINEMLEDGFHSINSLDVNGAGLIHYLAIGGHIDLAEKYDLAAVDESGKGIAEYAFLHKQIDFLRWLATKEEFPIVILLQYIAESFFWSKDERFYTDWGIKLIQLIHGHKDYIELSKTKNKISAIFSVFFFVFNSFHSHLNFHVFQEPCPELTAPFSFTKQDQELIARLDKELTDKLTVSYGDFAQGTFSKDESFAKQAVWLLDAVSEFRNFDKSSYGQEVVILDSRIGWGSYGVVHKVIIMGKECAVKVSQEHRRTAFMAENKWLNYLRAIDPKGLAPLVQKIALTFCQSAAFIVMDLYERNLGQFLYSKENPQDISLSLTQKLVRQILDACLYLQKYNLVHADLKPENILMKGDRLVLADFDAMFRDSSPLEKQLPPYDLQSASYRSPECFIHAMPYGPEIDVWSFGCILTEFVIRRRLFPCPMEFPDYSVMLEHQAILGPYPKNLVEKGRKYSEHIKTEPAITSIEEQVSLHRLEEKKRRLTDLVLATLKFDPAQRISFKKAKEHPFFDLEEA